MTRERKIQILCKSQQKVYNTFADELSDYIQIQKARGIAQKPVLPAGATQKDGDWERAVNMFPERELNFLPKYNPPHPSCNDPGRGCPPSYPDRSWPPQGSLHGGSPPAVAGSASPLFPGHFLTRKRLRKPPGCPPHEAFSSSQSSSYSSSSSSSSSSTSDSGDGKYRHREKRRLRKSRRERDKRAKEEDSDREEKRRKQRRTERHKELDEGRKGQSEEEERRKKGGKNRSGNKSREKKARTDPEAAAGESWKQENVKNDKGELSVEQRDSEQDKPGRAKNKREKKKGKEDSRTEEEKLWDDCILGF